MKKYHFTVCGIMRDEGPYLEEWIEFHLLQGVEHFYIWEHESVDNTREILERYQELGLVTLHSAYGHKPQRQCYQTCLEVYGHESQWMAFIDCDEFLYLTIASRTVASVLPDYEAHGAVAVNWILYGSGGAEKYYDDLVINRFEHRAKKVDQHVKSIVQPHLTTSVGNNAHYFILTKPAVNEFRKELPKEYYWAKVPTAQLLRINHYHTKSKEEYFKRKGGKLDVDGVDRGEVSKRFEAHDVNEIEERMHLILIGRVKYKITMRRNS